MVTLAAMALVIASIGANPAASENVAWGKRPPPAAASARRVERPDERAFTTIEVKSGASERAGASGRTAPDLTSALTRAQRMVKEGGSVIVRLPGGVHVAEALAVESATEAGGWLVLEGSPDGTTVLTGSRPTGPTVAIESDDIGIPLPVPSPRAASAWRRTDSLLLQRELVFDDGVRLEPVGARADLSAGRYWIDDDRRLVVVPAKGGGNGVNLRVSWSGAPAGSPMLDLSRCPQVVLRRLTFHGGPQGYGNHFAVRLAGRSMIEDCAFLDNGSGGLGITGADRVTIARTRFSGNGGLGLFAWRVRELVLEDCRFEANNWRGALVGYTAWSVAGAKLHFVEGVSVERCVFSGNHAPGLWFDLWCYGVALEDCTFTGHQLEPGLLLELSEDVTVTACRFEGNSEGVRLHDAGRVGFEGCVLVGNGAAVTVFESLVREGGRERPGHRGADAGRLINLGSFAFTSCGFSTGGAAPPARLPAWMRFRDPGHPVFFHSGNADRAGTLRGLFHFKNTTFDATSGERPFPSADGWSSGWEGSGEAGRK